MVAAEALAVHVAPAEAVAPAAPWAMEVAPAEAAPLAMAEDPDPVQDLVATKVLTSSTQCAIIYLVVANSLLENP